jgi:hypothetical protein
MELTRSAVERAAGQYEDVQPMYAVEQEHVEMLPETFRSGGYGWRDAEWVVQWFYRRFLGAFPNRDRRAAEGEYGENAFDDVLDAVAAAVEREDTAARLDALTDLSGVDVAVASAFLLFLSPERYVVVDERTWAVLHEAGELDRPYDAPPGVEEYLAFDAACTRLRERFDVDAWTLYRALWVLGREA